MTYQIFLLREQPPRLPYTKGNLLFDTSRVDLGGGRGPPSFSPVSEESGDVSESACESSEEGGGVDWGGGAEDGQM